MMTLGSKKIGRVVRINWDDETGDMSVVFDITDEEFKSKILHNKDFEDVLELNGKDVMVVAARNKED